MTETNNILEPPHWVCEICNDDGKCLANESHPDYEFDASDGLRYFDCWNYILKRDKEKRESTMQTVRHLIEWKQAEKKDKVFLYIFGNAKIYYYVRTC